MGTYLPYSDDEDKIIITLHKQGISPQDMTGVLKSRTEKQIRDRGYSLGLKWTPEPEIDMTEFKRLMGKK